MSKERLEDIKNGTYLYFRKHNELKEDMDWLIEQAERVQELEKENRLLRFIAEENKIAYEQRAKQNKRYREALEFYADKENYKPFDGIFLSRYQNKIDEDGGEKARQALEGEAGD